MDVTDITDVTDTTDVTGGIVWYCLAKLGGGDRIGGTMYSQLHDRGGGGE